MRRWTGRVALALGLLFCFALACGRKSEAPAPASAPAEMEAKSQVADEGRAMPSAPPPRGMVTGNADKPAQERLIVRRAELRLKVEQVSEAAEVLQAQAQKYGGFVVTASVSGEPGSAFGQVTYRVPAERFAEALKEAEEVAEKVLSKTVNGEDVTEEYVDLEAQLKNLEASKARLMTFLDRAARVEEALEVNRAVTDIQGQIERLQGRMKYLRQSAALSTIAATLTQESVVPVVEEGGWKPLRVARKALRSFLGFLQVLGDLLIVAAVWSPLWLFLWWLLRAWKRRRVARKAAKAAKAAEGPAAK